MKRLLLVVSLFLTSAASAMPVPVSDLPASCTYNGGTSCAKTYDATSGVCRTIRFSTSAGEIQVLVCDKTDHYELYRQSYPSTITFKACVGGGSVDPISGFSSFTSTTLGSGCGAPPPPPSNGTPLIDPSSVGFGGQTRSANHARLLDAWWTKPEVVQHFACSYGNCAWVPWYQYSDRCGLADLQPLEKCGGSGTPSLSHNCMVSDEFSQLLLATAQGTDNGRVKELFNTLRLIASGNNGGIFGTLPTWNVRRHDETVYFSSSGSNRDSASDADARIVLALYIAAASADFPEADRTTYRNYANTMAADFLTHDFRRGECHTGRNGGQICDWLAAGGNAADSPLSHPTFTYAGYFGDAAIALLAAYKALNQSQYLNAARDTINAYLLAADFNGSFRVPPKKFSWDTSVSPTRSVCDDGSCVEWDDSDAPRATSICKVKYYASLLNTTLSADLDSYCNAWRSRGGLTSTQYKIQYSLDGTPISGWQDGPYENGLASSLDFAYGSDLVPRIDHLNTKWDPNPLNNPWYGQQCIGIFRNAFFPANLGTAIGRDLNVWQ